MGPPDAEKESGSADLNGEYPNGDSEERSEFGGGLKSCTDCRTTKTPLWRGGPTGPKSLCNACGIRWRKKRREILGLKEGAAADKEKSKSKDNKKQRSNAGGGGGGGGVMSVLRLLEFGTGVLFKQKKRSSLLRLKGRGRLEEEEEAAVLLMALSSGFLYA